MNEAPGKSRGKGCYGKDKINSKVRSHMKLAMHYNHRQESVYVWKRANVQVDSCFKKFSKDYSSHFSDS